MIECCLFRWCRIGKKGSAGLAVYCSSSNVNMTSTVAFECWKSTDTGETVYNIIGANFHSKTSNTTECTDVETGEDVTLFRCTNTGTTEYRNLVNCRCAILKHLLQIKKNFVSKTQM